MMELVSADGRKERDPREGSYNYYNRTSVKFNNKSFDFHPTQFVIDDNYIGEPPKVQVSLEGLNDNIDENFLRRDLKNFKVKSVEIVRHTFTKQHLGLAKIIFEDPQDAQHCVDALHAKSLMGNKLNVYLDARFAKIERKKDDILNPKPAAPTVVPVVDRLPTISPVTPSSITTASTAFATDIAPRGRLEDRIAIIMGRPGSVLAAIPNLTPSQPQQPSPPALNQAFHPNNESNKSLDTHNRHSNHINGPYNSQKPYENPKDVYKQPLLPPPPPNDYEFEDDKAWNPEPKEEVEPPLELILTEAQINDIIAPFAFERFYKDIEENLHQTICRKLTTNYGYPTIDEAQKKHQVEEVIARREEEKKKQKERQAAQQREFMNKFLSNERVTDAEKISQPRIGFLQQRRGNQSRVQQATRKINRSSAHLHEPGQRGPISDSNSIYSSGSSRRSRSHSRRRSSSRSSSSSSASSSSSSSLSSASSSSSSLTSSGQSSRSSSRASSQSRSPTPSREHRREDAATVVPSVAIARPAVERDAIEALLGLNTSSGLAGLKSEKTSTKKRKIKDEPIVPSVKKVKKEKASKAEPLVVEEEENEVEEKSTATLTFSPRLESEKEKLINDIRSMNEEDLKHLETIHKRYMEEIDNGWRFGSYSTNMAHLVAPTVTEEIIGEKKNRKNRDEKSKQPKWWNGCSRCSIIVSSDKGEVEETTTTFEDLTKAPIKSHVIQAANSTRRDQKNDQRRLALLNPDIDPSLLKQFTSNTLQMRSKNLRFSRSKIHKWGLFACEKITNGDAVIEYVGEKIRPSLADHREKFVYTNLATHDGSSYFFRVDTDVIDATLKGNKARFINHCCNPNCIAKVIRHDNGSNSIVIYAKQTINEDEEITYDYKFPREEQKIKCECKAQNCQGFLN